MTCYTTNDNPQDYMRGGLASHLMTDGGKSGDLLMRLLCMDGIEHIYEYIPSSNQPKLLRLWKAYQRNRGRSYEEWRKYCQNYIDRMPGGSEFLGESGECYDWEEQLGLFDLLIRKYADFAISRETKKLRTKYMSMSSDISGFMTVCRDNDYMY